MEDWLKEVILPFILLIVPIILFMNYCMYVHNDIKTRMEELSSNTAKYMDTHREICTLDEEECIVWNQEW